MILTRTIPSLSGTFGIPARLALNPKMPKEPSSPSRSNARIERQLHGEMNQGQRTTANISKLGVSGLRKVCIFNQNYSGLIVNWLRNPSLLIPARRCSQF
jgi:hypothetical protein